MTIALIDNGSLEPAAHRNLRGVAAALAERAGVTVHAVSWKHSDRIHALAADGNASGGDTSRRTARAWTLAPFVRAQVARGEREFVFVPFFISPQGAIGSALRNDLEKLRRELGGFELTFTDGLVERGAIPAIVAARIRETIAARPELFGAREGGWKAAPPRSGGFPAAENWPHGYPARPPVIVVDHGGPSPVSAALRDELAEQIRAILDGEIGPLAAASLEGERHAHNRPLFADQLMAPGFDRGEVIVAPLFLAPGRHAGPRGDLARIVQAAEDRLALPPLRCHFTGLVGTHPLVLDTLAAALQRTLSTFHASFA
jgi:sirohydrochlorin ferrochelatase